MKKIVACLCLSLYRLAPTGAAFAKGCLKGAIVGGVLGHYAGHHGVLGAVAGCAYGRHEANKNHRGAGPRAPIDRYGRAWI